MSCCSLWRQERPEKMHNKLFPKPDQQAALAQRRFYSCCFNFVYILNTYFTGMCLLVTTLPCNPEHSNEMFPSFFVHTKKKTPSSMIWKQIIQGATEHLIVDTCYCFHGMEVNSIRPNLCGVIVCCYRQVVKFRGTF